MNIDSKEMLSVKSFEIENAFIEMNVRQNTNK